jgi:DNA-binding NarL/FixJ family response regulator
VAAQIRVFLIGVGQEDLAPLRSRAKRDPALTVVGEALQTELAAGRATLPAAIDAVLMTPEAATRTVASGPPPPTSAGAAEELIEELTPRERDVLALLSDGYGNRVIAERLGVSEHTVKFHLASIFGKLGASTRTEAVRRGLDLGIIDI